MSMELWWNAVDKGKPKHREKSALMLLFHHKFHMNWHGIEQAPQLSNIW